MVNRSLTRPDSVAPVDDLDPSPRVVWRTWVIAPHRDPKHRATAILTGVFGFPWHGPELQARCTADDTATRIVSGAPRPGGRHHPSVPDPACTCGIYASADLTETPAIGLLPPAQPIATGFVRLGGTTMRSGVVIRAQLAEIIGPITLLPGKPPLTTRILDKAGYRPGAPLVVVEGNRFRVSWSRARVGSPFAEWRRWARSELSHRYRVDVI